MSNALLGLQKIVTNPESPAGVLGLFEGNHLQEDHAEAWQQYMAEGLLQHSDADAMSSTMDQGQQAYIDARTDLVRAQNDARFAEVAGKIDTLAGKIDGLSGRLDGVVTRLDGLPTRRDAWLAPASAAAGLFLAGLAVLAFAGDRFDSGFGLAEKQQEQLERDRQQDEVIKRMDAILNRLDAQSASPATPAAPSGTTSGN